MTFIRSVETVSAPHEVTADELYAVAQKWISDQSSADLYTRFLQSSQAARRRYVLPLEEILSLGGQEQRAEIFLREGKKLAEQAIVKALRSANYQPEEVETLIFTSCTVPTIPGLDSILMQSLGMRPTIQRVPVYQYGCAGGVSGLTLADKLAANGPVVLCSLELCSLLFQMDDVSKGQLVGSALFADGAAAVVIDMHEAGFRILDSQPFIIPETTHLMGYDLKDNGMHLRLDRQLPEAVGKVAPQLVDNFLQRNKMIRADISWWLIHPGGTRILQSLAELLKIDEAQMCWSQRVLSEQGNLSSAAILFVFREFLNDGLYSKGDKVLTLGIGPGVSLELLLLEAL